MANLNFPSPQLFYIPTPIGVAFITAVAVWFELRRRRVKSPRLPPGPPPKKLLGIPVTTDLPTTQEWVTYSKWAKEYGDLYHIKLLGHEMIILNTFEAAYDLFEKTSSIYSDRPDFPMVNDIIGFDWQMAFMRYGEEWRRHRKFFHLKFHPAASEEYHPAQLRHTRELLRRLYEEPQHHEAHLRHTAGAIIMEIVYGIKVKPKNDYFIDIAESGMHGLTVAGNFGTFLVDSVPILKYVPPWIPGAEFARLGALWKHAMSQMSLAPFQEVKRVMAKGEYLPSITSVALEELVYASDSENDLNEEVIRGAGSAAYAAGSDTTVSLLHIFLLAMVCYPEVQRKAQEELDRVIGHHRLPEFGDRESLPYIELVMKEVYRWQPVVPLGVAHATTEDNTYGGFHIPKGAIVVGNLWHMLHDEKNYGKDTHKFIPERFLEPGRKDPVIAFGFGRRICPGRYMADNSAFIAIASILQVFNVTPAKDETGKCIPVKEAFTSGFMSHPEPFQCEIKFRSESYKNLLF